MIIFVSDEHPLNAELPISKSSLGSKIVVSDEHPRNYDSQILLILLGIIIFLTDLSSLKQKIPISVNPNGIFISWVSFEPWK